MTKETKSKKSETESSATPTGDQVTIRWDGTNMRSAYANVFNVFNVFNVLNMFNMFNVFNKFNVFNMFKLFNKLQNVNIWQTSRIYGEAVKDFF